MDPKIHINRSTSGLGFLPPIGRVLRGGECESRPLAMVTLRLYQQLLPGDRQEEVTLRVGGQGAADRALEQESVASLRGWLTDREPWQAFQIF